MPKDIFGSITWQSVLIGVLLFLVTFTISLAIVSFILVRIPPDYFHKDRPRDLWSDRHPAVRLLGLFAKNLLGVVLVVLGILLSIPGVPGQGLLTILLGIMLLDFPGKRCQTMVCVFAGAVRHVVTVGAGMLHKRPRKKWRVDKEKRLC